MPKSGSKYAIYSVLKPLKESKAVRAVLVTALIVAWSACRTSQESVETPSPATAEERSTSMPKPSDDDRIVRLDPQEAAEFAQETQQEVSAEAVNGLTLDLWATEQLIEDPIALDVDDEGRLYVTASSRTAGGEIDIRGHPTWTTPALAMQSVEDHETFLKQEIAPENSEANEWLPDFNEDGSHDWRDLTVLKERLYRVEDRSGDGVADAVETVVEGFNTPVTDVLGGLLVHDGKIYLAAAPDLWVMDVGDRQVEDLQVMSTGYGVHPGFGGHGMSGITVGPEGRIYWSVGDMGMNVVGPDGRRWYYPHQGTIVRAFPDGSGFEVFAAGLRNTHEFVFDEFGNLISVDNDGDHPGEKERIVYVVEGSDSGWRTNWQFGKYTDPKNNDYKVWMDEELFKPSFPGQAAYITPPVANYHSGPAGMVYHPGTALGGAWKDHFFISEYTGSPATTNVHAFRLEEEGAGFSLASDQPVVSGVLTVGMDFGMDGALYLADWIEGWDSKGAGRIWKLHAPGASTLEVASLMASDFEERSVADLKELLGHADRRVRQKAQFELAERGDYDALLDVARNSGDRITRVHGLWGLWQLALQDASSAEAITAFLSDDDDEIRAQAAKILGDVAYESAAEAIVPLLQGDSERIRFFAAQALGKMEYAVAFDPIVAMLQSVDEDDDHLRHAGSLALARIADGEAIGELSSHPSAAVRMAAVVALRRLKHPAVGRFVDDEDEHIVTEAARAINDDGGIKDALLELAGILNATDFTNEPLLRRVISANLRVGSEEAAERVAAFARRDDVPPSMRVEAVSVLGVWPEPSVLDRVDGDYLGPVERSPDIARSAAASLLEPLSVDTLPEVKVALAETAARLKLADAAPFLLSFLEDGSSAEVRVAALEALNDLAVDDMESVVRTALADADQSVRMTAVRLIPTLGLGEVTTAELLANAVDRGSVEEQQSALQALGELQSPSARDVLEDLITELEAGRVDRGIRLDVMEAAEAGGSEELRQRVETYRESSDPYAHLMEGGDADRGRSFFFRHEAAQCVRCHAINGRGGDVGPDLASIGAILSREELVESLLEPSERIAPGYGSENAPSAMPPMGGILSDRQVRDVVAFLSRLQ